MELNMDDIIPISEFRDNLGRFVEDLQSHGGKKVVTINGKPALGVMEAQELEHTLNELMKLREENEKIKILMGVLKGMDEIERGEFHTIDEVKNQLGF
jgi:PHD/YefM family antitoxin component YafN of YafNO toxin-antitoxin module